MSILLIKQHQYNNLQNDDILIQNEIYDEIIDYEELIYSLKSRRIVTFNNNIQIVKYEYSKWIDDFEEFNCYGDLLNKIAEEYKIKSNWTS